MYHHKRSGNVNNIPFRKKCQVNQATKHKHTVQRMLHTTIFQTTLRTSRVGLKQSYSVHSTTISKVTLVKREMQSIIRQKALNRNGLTAKLITNDHRKIWCRGRLWRNVVLYAFARNYKFSGSESSKLKKQFFSKNYVLVETYHRQTSIDETLHITSRCLNDASQVGNSSRQSGALGTAETTG